MVVGEFAEQRELIIVGGGPGGYNAAIRAAQLGIQVTLIEKEEVGGVCLNKGCIPSKVFTHTAKQLASIPNLSNLGISVGSPSVNFTQLIAYKDQKVEQLRKGVEALCSANQIEIIRGTANFTSNNRIGVEIGHRFEQYEFKHAIIATGGSYRLPENLRQHEDRLKLPDTIYNISEMPEEIIVYGSDYIALEAAFSFHHLGATVTMVLDEEGGFAFDESINRELKRILKKEKIKVYQGYTLEAIKSSAESIEVKLSTDENTFSISGDYLYLGTDHRPNIDELGIERLGITLTDDGFINVDNQMRTTLDSIFAIGDTTVGTASAVKAIKQGKVVAETIAGLKSELDLTFIPDVVHSIPPIAAVGLTEAEAKEQGYNAKVSQFPYGSNSYGTITDEKNGVTKVIKDAETDLLLGYHSIGAGAIELISSAVTALEMAGHDEDLKFPLYPHPSYNETLLEAVEGLTESAIHKKPKKQKAKL
ncbi:dihydrolipoyl dehydrogenase family protein [Virgibacillus kekensis]|uniref:Dihydrolipoyl dehydrogenase family protein n=1 Tax=Virgibacillus kekensis TaxID=202261 RepID=A0ABV9DHQ9_9BACI